jgi:hypothetical protein
MNPLWSGDPQEAAPDPPARRHAQLYEAEYAKQLRRIERIRKAVGRGDVPLPPRRPEHSWDEPPAPPPRRPRGEDPSDDWPLVFSPGPPPAVPPADEPPREAGETPPAGEAPAPPAEDAPAEPPPAPDDEPRAAPPAEEGSQDSAGEESEERLAGEAPRAPRTDEPRRPRRPEPSPPPAAPRRARLATFGLPPRDRRAKRVDSINGHGWEPPQPEGPTGNGGTRQRWAAFVAGLAVLGVGALGIALLAAPNGGPQPKLISLPGPATDIAAGGGRVWAAAPDRGEVWVLDGKSGHPVAPAVKTAGTPARLAVHGSDAWAADTADAALVRLRGAGAPVRVGPDVADVGFAGGSVWAASAADGMVRVLDAGGRRPRALAIGGHPIALAGDARNVVVASSDGEVTWLDARTRKNVAAVRVGGTPIAIAMDGGAAWVADSRGGTVRRISLRSGAATRGGASGGGPAAGGATGAKGGAAGVVVGRALEVGPKPVAIAAAGGEIYVACRGDDSMAVVDARRGVVTRRVALGVEPAAIAVGGEYVWVAAAGRSAMARIDRRRLT